MEERPKLVLTNIEHNVGYIVFNRSEFLNAFNLDLAQQFLQVVEAFREDRNVRAVVVKGAGKAFSAGGDVKEMLRNVLEGQDRAAFFRSPLAAFNKMVLSLRSMPKPVCSGSWGCCRCRLQCDVSLRPKNCERGNKLHPSFHKGGIVA